VRDDLSSANDAPETNLKTVMGGILT